MVLGARRQDVGFVLRRQAQEATVHTVDVEQVLGDIEAAPAPLVRVHSECLTGDVFGSGFCKCGPTLGAAMVHDIATMKRLGFTVLRKHLKVEPLRWYHHCDRLGMHVANVEALRRAVALLEVPAAYVLTDGFPVDGLGTPGLAVWKGDRVAACIAAASVLAKVTRDRIMRAEAQHFPAYDFDLNKGYPCPRHKAALAAWGPSSIHRRAWVFMDHQPWDGVQRLVRDLQPALW